MIENKITHLSLIIPCYNEEATLAESLKRAAAIGSDTLKLEFIIIDDASKDRSVEIIKEFAKTQPNVQLVEQPVNRGKGAALRAGFGKATGEYVAIQDADLEYNPQDLLKMVPILNENRADVVYGTRFRGENFHSTPYGLMHRIGNELLTFASNLFTGIWLSDMETCYKMFRREIIQSLDLCEERFGIEPEITAKWARLRINGKRPRFAEVPVEYKGRSYEDGKKIGMKDAFRAFYCIVKYRFL